MNQHIETIIVQVSLSAYGDSLIYGIRSDNSYVGGQYLKQRLFAWHEETFYGTELELQSLQDIELILLPAEHFISFFSEAKMLTHIEWIWGAEAAAWMPLVPLLASWIEEKKYHPSLSAFREGSLAWTWDQDALSTEAQELLVGIEREADEDTILGLHAAFSAAIFQRYYSTESAAADLRNEYPLLFTSDSEAAAGMDEHSWLIAIGWMADTAPFRPLLQLLEPDEEESDWRLQLILQDKQDPTVLVPVQLSQSGQAYGSWPASWSSYVTERSSSWLERLLACLPEEWLHGQENDILGQPLQDEAAWRFLTLVSQHLLEAGWQVLLPAWWEAASRKKPKLRAKVRSEEGANRKGSSMFGLDSIIQFDWRIAIGDANLTESEFEALVARNERLIRFRGQWIALDPLLLAQIRQMMTGMDRRQGLSFQDVLQLHLLGLQDEESEAEVAEKHARSVQLEVELNEQLTQVMDQLKQQQELPALAVPAGLRAELRSYQREGFAWLSFLRRLGLGACLADDMGLGKTIQFITYLLHVKESEGTTTSPSLLICPTSVLGNWQKELSRFAPSLRVMIHYGSGRADGESFLAEAQEADIVLTSYATAALDQELLKTVTWASLCLDEAQNIKNAQTKQSSAVRQFPAKHRIALTGTPIENRLSELWSIYDFINPGYLGNAKAFHNRFIQAIEKNQDLQKTQELQRLVKPFMLRRKKKDPAIQLDLPDKNEMKTYVHLTAEQGAMYDHIVSELMDKMKQLEGIERKGAILSALTKLKQLCDHPVLLTKEAIAGPSVEEPQDNEPMIVRSAKLERLVAMVKELREDGERCLIFTQYIGMGNMLQQILASELGEPVLYLNGSTSKTARDRMIEQFQSRTLPADLQPSVFILSIKAGGVGLNLTAANHVFHYDRWWNPAVENQATDRAYRMGQTKDVQVYKFISLGTLEERIDEMLESKQQLSDQIISTSENWITELSTDELKDLFTLRRTWNG